MSNAAQKAIEDAVDAVDTKINGIENAFVIIGQDIVSSGKTIKNGVLGAVTEAANMLEDIGIYDPNAHDEILVALDIFVATHTVVAANPLNDAAMQQIIYENLLMAREAAQEALNSQWDEAQRINLINTITQVKQSITTTTDQIVQGIAADAAEIKSHVASIKGTIYDAWMNGNFGKTKHPDGYALTANALVGAKDAMNEKYGEGSVVW